MLPVRLSIILVCFSMVPTLLTAADHNNLDDGQPLQFEDATSIADGERQAEFGIGGTVTSGRTSEGSSALGFAYGFARNLEAAVALTTGYAFSHRQLQINGFDVSVMHALRRELRLTPAVAYRLRLHLPVGSDTDRIAGIARVMLSRSLGAYNTLHLNLDASYAGSRPGRTDKLRLGAVLGYSIPLGFPKSFNRTLLLEIGARQSGPAAQGWNGIIGLGLRQQITPAAVLDLGIEHDALAATGFRRSPFRASLGFALSF